MTLTHSLDGQHCGQQEGQHGLPGWIGTAGQLLQTQRCGGKTTQTYEEEEEDCNGTEQQKKKK